jgi:hypothetical protein
MDLRVRQRRKLAVLTLRVFCMSSSSGSFPTVVAIARQILARSKGWERNPGHSGACYCGSLARRVVRCNENKSST